MGGGETRSDLSSTQVLRSDTAFPYRERVGSETYAHLKDEHGKAYPKLNIIVTSAEEDRVEHPDRLPGHTPFRNTSSTGMKGKAKALVLETVVGPDERHGSTVFNRELLDRVAIVPAVSSNDEIRKGKKPDDTGDNRADKRVADYHKMFVEPSDEITDHLENDIIISVVGASPVSETFSAEEVRGLRSTRVVGANASVGSVDRAWTILIQDNSSRIHETRGISP